jgi:hypothetical protein
MINNFSKHQCTILSNEWQVRKAFNYLRLYERAAQGEFLIDIIQDKLITQDAPDKKAGDRRQKIAYIDQTGNRIALVVQLVKPDGTLGWSGYADPKTILLGGIVFAYYGTGIIEGPPPRTP